ncbi:Site-specific DNA-methyltransferase (adenine-specific) [Gammaproteobacteria bacterium]
MMEHIKLEELRIQKPFLKWLGGKTQIMNHIINKFPNTMNNYHELFLGGGSVLLTVLSLRKQNLISITNNIYAYDINESLIYVYKHIQDCKDELYSYLIDIKQQYDNINGIDINRKSLTLEEALTSKESYFYWMRHQYNTLEVGNVYRSALFIIINKTCFRGMYREGPNGYNVPFGHYKISPKLISKEELDNISLLIRDVRFIHSDYRESIKNITYGDFVYLDPPYAPESKNSFIDYVAGGFDLQSHVTLFHLVDDLNEKNIKFIMSNSKAQLVLDYLKNYSIYEIYARRSINSKNPASKTIELVICN